MIRAIIIFTLFSINALGQTSPLKDTVNCEPLPTFLQFFTKDICDVLVTSPVCQSIKKEYQISCEKMSSYEKDWSFDVFREECKSLAKNALINFGTSLWELTKYSVQFRYDPITQTKAGIETQLAFNEAKLLFDVEYELAQSELDDKNKPKNFYNIAKQMSLNVYEVIYKEIESLVRKEISHYSCLNSQGKSELMCSLVSQTFVPPVGAFLLLKYGDKATQFFTKFKETIMRFSNFGLSPNRIFPLATSQVIKTPLKKLKGRKSSVHEKKLRSSNIVSKVPNPNKGMGKSYIVTLEDGTKAIWKPHQYVWHQNYRAEILAYEIDQKMGFNLVPPTVERTIDGRKGSLQIHIDSLENKLDPDADSGYLALQYLTLNFDHEKLVKMNGDSFSIDHGAAFVAPRVAEVDLENSRVIESLKKYFTSPRGKEIIEDISQNITPEFEAELAEYLGKKDAKRTIIRMKRLVEMSKQD